jgi:siroheme synthase
MSKRPASVTQADIERAIRAAKKAGGLQVVVRLKEGEIVIQPVSVTTDTVAESEEVVL